LVKDEITIEAGRIALPQRPGLGIELNQAAIEKYAAAALEKYSLVRPIVA
jgi:L-alanine-DL-glutamate epimerase-like enolase superfamily enzyme